MNNKYFSNEIIYAVWGKGIVVQGYDPKRYRKDIAGAWMVYSDYGNTDSLYGWEIDHIRPKSLGGDDNIDNLQPMQWMNNREKGDSYPAYQTSISSQENKNIKLIRYY